MPPVISEIFRGRICDVEIDDPYFVPLVRVNLLTGQIKLKYTQGRDMWPYRAWVDAMMAEAQRQLDIHNEALK